jgi:hypothetical protein
MWYISMLSAFTLRDLVDHFAVIRPGYFGQDTSIASTAPAFRESTFFTEGNVCRRCQLCPVVPPTYVSGGHTYVWDRGIRPLHNWLS